MQLLLQLQTFTSLPCTWVIFVLLHLWQWVPSPLDPSTTVIRSAFCFAPVSHAGTKSHCSGRQRLTAAGQLFCSLLLDISHSFLESCWARTGYLGIWKHYSLMRGEGGIEKGGVLHSSNFNIKGQVWIKSLIQILINNILKFRFY